MSNQSNRRPAGVKPQGLILALVAAIGLYGAHYLFAGFAREIAFALTVYAGLAVAGVLLHPGLRRDILSYRDLTAPGLLFLGCWLVGAWMLTPWIPGGPHPVWEVVGDTPAGTIDRSATIEELIKLLGLASLFVLGMAIGASDERARTALNLFIGIGVVFGLWATLLWAMGIDPAGIRRLSAHFMSANTAATFFGMLLMLCLGELLRRRDGPRAEQLASAAPYIGAAVFFAGCVMMTASRGGLAATLGGISLLLVLAIFSGRMKVRAGMLVSVAGVALALVAGQQVTERLAQSSADLHKRTDILEAHWHAIQASPWFGYGLGSFDTVNKTLLTPSNIETLGETRLMHNAYLTWLEQAGLVGATLMFLCVGLIIWRTFRSTVQRSRMTTVLFGLLAANMVIMLHAITDIALETPSMAAFWSWILGLQFALSKGSRR